MRIPSILDTLVFHHFRTLVPVFLKFPNPEITAHGGLDLQNIFNQF